MRQLQVFKEAAGVQPVRREERSCSSGPDRPNRRLAMSRLAIAMALRVVVPKQSP